MPTTSEIREARARALYHEDETLTYRKSHDNPVVKKIYEDFLTEGPCGKLSHKLLHTTYLKRGNEINEQQAKMNAQQVKPAGAHH